MVFIGSQNGLIWSLFEKLLMALKRPNLGIILYFISLWITTMDGNRSDPFYFCLSRSSCSFHVGYLARIYRLIYQKIHFTTILQNRLKLTRLGTMQNHGV